jgi:spore cortex formation protein SpoVR/YcgB (stage V sporulation)
MDRRGDRALTLRYFSYQRRPLHEDFTQVLDHVAHLWGFPVRLEEQTVSGEVNRLAERKSP